MIAKTDRPLKRRIHWAPLVAIAAMGTVAACSTTGASPGPTGAPAEDRVPVVGAPGAMLATAGPYRVVAVVDVNTIELDRGTAGGITTARLLGVAGPALGDRPRCFGAEGVAESHRLLDGQDVRIVADPGWSLRDGDGHLSVYVWLGSGRMANHLLIEGGFARAATGVAPYVYRETFAAAEERARGEGRGLWPPQSWAGKTARRPA